jgi:hypothetical protein
MSEWIDFAVYASFTAVMWGWLPAQISRSVLPVIADRNPEWLTKHPELQERLAHGALFSGACLLWGVLSFASLLALQMGVWPQRLLFLSTAPKWEALKELHSVLLIIGLIAVAGWATVFLRWLHRNVPLATRRQATLERRSLHDYVPPALQHAIYGIVTLHLGLWVLVGVAGRYATTAFWGSLMFQFVISAVFLLVALSAVRRRPAAMDRIFGPGYRRMEVRVTFAAQLLPLMNGAARLYEQVANMPVVNVDRVLHLGFVLMVLTMALLLGHWSRRAAGTSGSWWLPSATSADVH